MKKILFVLAVFASVPVAYVLGILPMLVWELVIKTLAWSEWTHWIMVPFMFVWIPFVITFFYDFLQKGKFLR
jgi:hypothetical protein